MMGEYDSPYQTHMSLPLNLLVHGQASIEQGLVI
jgi:hypothetical protein